MIKWLKTILKDLGNLDRGQFFMKYVLPALVIFFTWGLIGHLFLLSLNTSSLLPNKGSVTNIAVVYEQGTRARYKYYPLKIALTNHPKEFRLPDVHQQEFPYLLQRIAIGDTITVYTRHRWQALLSWGK